MPPTTTLWISVTLTLIYVLCLLVSKASLRKRLVAQHHRLQLADTQAQLQEKEVANANRQKDMAESKLRSLQLQYNGLEQEKDGLQSSTTKQGENITKLKNELGNLQAENKRLSNPNAEIEHIKQQLRDISRQKDEAELRHKEYVRQTAVTQENVDNVIRQLLVDAWAVTQRIAELTGGKQITYPNATAWQQAAALNQSFKNQIIPALDRLAVKVKTINASANGSIAYNQYRKQAYYEVKDMEGHTFLCLHPYLPTRYQATATEQAIRNLVYGFKDGINTAQVADAVAIVILRSFPAQELNETVLVIVPASTKTKNEVRFKRFCELVCARTGLVNGYNAIKPVSDREAFKGQTRVNKTTNLTYERELIAQKRILLFDDVMTTGASFKQNAQLLKQHGADHVTGLFLARTVNR